MTTNDKPVTKQHLFPPVEIPPGLVQKVDWVPNNPQAAQITKPKINSDGQLAHGCYKRPAAERETCAIWIQPTWCDKPAYRELAGDDEKTKRVFTAALKWLAGANRR